jgi:hypothetical protein
MLTALCQASCDAIFVTNDFAKYGGDTNPHRRGCIQRVKERSHACAGVTTLRLRIN